MCPQLTNLSQVCKTEILMLGISFSFFHPSLSPFLLSFFIFFFLFFFFLCKTELQRQGDIKSEKDVPCTDSSPTWWCLALGQARSQEPQQDLYWASSAAFSGYLAAKWTKSGAARTPTSTHLGCRHSGQWLYLLCHNDSLQKTSMPKLLLTESSTRQSKTRITVSLTLRPREAGGRHSWGT